MARELVLLLAAVVAVPLLVAGVLLTLVLAAIPVASVRRAAGTVQRLLSASVGDSYALLASPIRKQAILEQIDRALDWLTERCDTVAVVAHSQGAAVTELVLTSPTRSRVRSVVALGSGQTKLRDLEALRRTAAAHEVWLAPVGLAVVSSAIWSALEGLATGGVASAWGMAVYALIGVALLVLGLRAAWPVAGDALASGALPVQDWLDLYASHDPVANGPVHRGRAGPPVRSRRTDNRASFVRDHTAYWRNRDDALPEVIGALARACDRGIDRQPGDVAARVAAGARRRWRVAWLRHLRLVALVVAGAIAWVARAELAPLGRRLVDGVAGLTDAVPLVSAELSGAALSTPAATVAGIAAVALAVTGGYLVAAAAWSLWDHRDAGHLIGGPAVLPWEMRQLWPLAMVAWLSLVGVLIATGLVAAGGVLDLRGLRSEAPRLPVLLLAPLVTLAASTGMSEPLARIGLTRTPARVPDVTKVLVIAGPLLLLARAVAADTAEAPGWAWIATVAVIVGIPLLARPGADLWIASRLGRRVSWRMRAWARAEPAPLVAARALGPEAVEDLIAYAGELRVGLSELAGLSGPTAVDPAVEDAAVPGVSANVIARARDAAGDTAIATAELLRRWGRPTEARELLATAAPVAQHAAEELFRLDPAATDATAALQARAQAGPLVARWRARRLLASAPAQVQGAAP